VYYYRTIGIYIINSFEVEYMRTYRSCLAQHANNIFFQYRNGVSARQIAKEYSVSVSTVTDFLKNHGIMPALKRGESDDRNYADRDTAIKLFNNGVRPHQIIKELNRSKSWFYSLSKANNLNLRGQNHNVPTSIQLSKGYSSKQASAYMTEAEQLLYDSLILAGYTPTPQYAIGGGNVDFVIDNLSIAIELCCRGTTSLYLRSGYLTDRIKELGKLGWHVYILYTRDANELRRHGIDDLSIWLEFIKRQPASRRQYRMIRSSGELLSVGCCDSNNLTGVETAEDLI
jgi:hypothetical protein